MRVVVLAAFGVVNGGLLSGAHGRPARAPLPVAEPPAVPSAAAAPSTPPLPPTTRCREEIDATLQTLERVTDPAEIWKTEVTLTRRLSRSDCAAALPGDLPVPALAPVPPRIQTEYQPLNQPTGSGAGPYILLGASGALIGGALFVDYTANDSRDAVQRAQARGDRRAFSHATVDFENQQTVARGLLAGGAAAAVGALVWALVGGNSDPVQSRPVFREQGESR